MQFILAYSYYTNTKFAIAKEVNAVLDESFQNDLNSRREIYKRISISKEITLEPQNQQKVNRNTDKVVAVYDSKKMKCNQDDYVDIIRRTLNDYISKHVPIKADSIAKQAKTSLIKRDIKSKFKIEIIDLKTNKTIESSNISRIGSLFEIQSKPLLLDFDNCKALRLTLIDPFASLFKMMGGLLITSLLLSLFCFFGLWFLFGSLGRQKELTALKDDFFGHIAHEIKRPVNHLVMAIDALSQNSTDTNPAFKNQCLTIQKNAIDEISEKMKMIMTLSMAEEGVFQLHYSEFDINQVIHQIVDKFSLFIDKKVVFSVLTPPSPICVKGDKEHLSQCIANLIDNAIKYSNESVWIEIKIETSGNEILLSVRDNGIGIDPQKLNTIFEKYSRLHKEKHSVSGYGIGLNYVKTIIEKHTGRIDVVSEETKGSEFRMWIPG